MSHPRLLSYPPIFYFILSLHQHAIPSQTIPKTDFLTPEITFTQFGEGWKNFTLSQKLAFYSSQGDTLNFKCRASYPIKWKIEGLIAPPEIVKIQPPRRDLSKNLYIIQINNFFLDAENYAGLAASANIACIKIDDQEIRKDFFIFVRGQFTLLPPVVNFVTDSSLIPCPTTDPTKPTSLYRQRTESGGEELVSDVTYNPTKGFLANNLYNGQYICKQGSSTVTIMANRTRTLRDFKFTPSQEELRAFTEDTIQLKCSSKTIPVKFLLRHSPSITLSWMEDAELSKDILLSFNSAVEAPRSNGSHKGSVVCVTRDRNELIKAWTYEFIETPQLYLDNFEGEADCLSKIVPEMVQTVRCKNEIDCDFMSHCFQNASSCNFKKQKQFYAKTGTFCWVEKLGRGEECVAVPYSHFNGLAQCTVQGLMKAWEFFVSLGFLKYNNWMDVPLRELLVLDEVPDVLYTNSSTQFFCTGVAYLFADSLSFELEYDDGSRLLLPNPRLDANISNPSSENSRKIDEFNVIGILDIMLPIDAVAVHCLAPWWNTSDVLSTTRNFDVRHLLPPTFLHQSQTSARQMSALFYAGEKNRRLTCHAKGEPEPIYFWLVEGKNATVAFPDLRITSGDNGEKHLEFPEVESKYAGIYECVAKNGVGEISQKFNLEVTDEPISGRSVVYITTVVVVLLFLTLLLIAFIILTRRYRAAKAMVRRLTDSEVDEFFHGKPELLSNTGINTMEIIDFLPYKNEYEIMMDDIEFDSSEKNWLGSGEFSYVVKGKIISKEKWVAVKISKPSADVNLFKSILSEVKIMIYIGKHENVVALVGVCTEQIRNRSIYIATEICEFGSLDSFLRKGRASYVNLLNGNQDLDMSLLPESGAQFSTLDLISFSAQIAKGMEYLAYKSIIHADLAARNVLLANGKIAKISDFGLSKKLYECNNYVKKSKTPLPWRWMSIEALTTLTFSIHSDVWSYGATLFEIFTLGDIPFPNEEWNKEFLTRLSSGMRMGRPKYSTQEIYSKIVACWETDPNHRPNFTTLRLFFDGLMQGIPEDKIALADLPPIGEGSTPTVTESLYVNCDGSYTVPLNYSELDFTESRESPNSPKPNYVNLE